MLTLWLAASLRSSLVYLMCFGICRVYHCIRRGIRTHTVQDLNLLPPTFGLYGRSATETRTRSNTRSERAWSTNCLPRHTGLSTEKEYGDH